MEYKTKMNCPRPQMIRQKWMSLNGLWDFAFDDENRGLTFEQYKDPSFFDQKIVVPYSYQTKKSLIERNEDHPIVWYRKEFEFDLENGKRAILHFDAVDYKADVFVNGRHMISHIGGHIPFEIDITDVIKERNEIIVRAEDFNLALSPSANNPGNLKISFAGIQERQESGSRYGSKKSEAPIFQRCA